MNELQVEQNVEKVEPIYKKPNKPTLSSMLLIQPVLDEQWRKLTKSSKLLKLQLFAEEYKNNNDLTTEEYEIMFDFLKDALEKKKLQRIKDIIYDKQTGIIKEIPGLVFVKQKKHFTFRIVNEKRVSKLKSLGPKKSSKNKNDLKDHISTT